MPYDELPQAIQLAERGSGSLVASLYRSPIAVASAQGGGRIEGDIFVITLVLQVVIARPFVDRFHAAGRCDTPRGPLQLKSIFPALPDSFYFFRT